MQGFFTGSRVYGTPREDSDLDLCVLVTADEFDTLLEAVEEVTDKLGDPMSKDEALAPSGKCPDQSLRFGKLNMICMIEPQELWQYKAWQTGTANLFARKPVTRDDAVRELDEQERIEKARLAELNEFDNRLQRAGRILGPTPIG